MRVGIGLPNAVSGTDGRAVLGWARQAEAAGFSTVASIDRVGYDNFEPFCTLAAAAAVTEHVRLLTAVALAPLRSTGLLAKAAATLDRLSAGRFTLGVGVGSREPDYRAAGRTDRFHRRGAVLDRQLDEMARLWRGDGVDDGGPVGPAPFTPGGPPVLVGGSSPATWTRVARAGAGWICGRGDAGTFGADVAEVRSAWSAGSRSGEPKLLALVYFSLGPGGADAAEGFVRDYYGYAPFVDSLLASVSTSDEAVQETAAGYAAAGCHELLFFPCSADVLQVDRLAGALSAAGPWRPG